jgi:hypothetical protein
VPVNENCPTFQDLEAFAVGDLPGQLLERVAAHVAGCESCESVLQGFDARADELVAGLKLLARRSNHQTDAPVPAKLVEIARTAGRTPADGAPRDVSLDPGRRLARELREGPCRLGRFDLECELGAGSFGYVFRARDTQLDRIVALKLQRAGRFADDEEVERFFREARSAAQLQHPGIVAIHDSGRTEDDVCYLVTEYIDGRSLDSRLNSGPIECREAARLVAQMADALQYAHEQGVIHRDIKPSNIVLDQSGHPHLTDFGLAKRSMSETITSDDRVMGTPAYMSPEQARGQSRQVDGRSDIYSLGVILYEALTGERPFQGSGRLLLLQVVEDEPRPPRRLNPAIPRDLETICLKAMAKSPVRRYQSAAELADDLRRCLRGEPIRARPMTRVERLCRWCRRYPLAASLLVAVPLGSAAGFWYLSRLSAYFIREAALDSTRMEADMLEKINTYYSEEVVGRLDWRLINVTHEYRTTPQSLPLPFTFMIDAGQRITEDESGMQVRLYSEHPWRKTGGPSSDFENRAVQALREKIAEPGGDRSYHEFSEAGGRPLLHYARAQIMKESCVKCHNDHRQSPKKDWKEGDLAGVLAITRPLDRDVLRTQAGLRGAFHVMGIFAALMTVLLFVLLWAARRHSHVEQ